MREGDPCSFSQKGNLYYMSAYAGYIRRRLIHCKYSYQSISIAYNRIPPHNGLSNSKTCQTHEIILIKPVFLSQRTPNPTRNGSELKENLWRTEEVASK